MQRDDFARFYWFVRFCWQWCLSLIKERTILAVLAVFALAVAGIVFHFSRLQNELIRTAALHDAERYSAAIASFRSLYTSEVVGRVRTQGIEVTHDYRDRNGAIPLPATLSMLLGNSLTQDSERSAMRLYSDYPFPWRHEGGPRSDFEREALRQLRSNPDRPYYRFSERDGRPVLQYATADRMRHSCVACHNSHPDSPKTDWKVGDVRGVLEIVRPLDNFANSVQAQLKSTALIWTVFAVILFASLMYVMASHVRRRVLATQALVEKELVTRENEELQEAIQRAEIEHNKAEQAWAELSRSEKLASVGQLAAGIAHEINTPIQFVGDNVSACADMFDDVKQVVGEYRNLASELEQQHLCAETVARVRELEVELDVDYTFEDAPKAFAQSLEGVERVRTIVQAMKDFSHVDRAGARSSFDLNAALESTITVSCNEWKYVAEIDTDFADLPLVEGYPGELNQVFLNLLINASHAIQDKGTDALGKISIQTRLQDDGVRISIADTGTGISESIRKKIFDPFFTTKPVGRGSGQGLAISYNIIVKRHYGRIDLESEEGEGTTFHIWLPLTAPKQEITDAQEAVRAE